METKRLYRSCKDRILGGVAAGIAEYFNIDPTLIRLLFAILIISGGVGLVAYIIAWVIIPEDPSCKSGKSGSDEIKEKAEQVASEIRKASENSKNREDFRFFIGLFVLTIGLMLFFQVLLGFHFFRILWPLAVLGTGVFIIINSMRK